MGNTLFFPTLFLKPSLIGQGAHTKNISQCFTDSDMDNAVENGEELEESSFNLPEVNVEITPPPKEFALVTPLEDEMEESVSDIVENSGLDINAEFDKVMNDLASSCRLREGARNKKFYRRSLRAISKKEKNSFMQLSDKSITKARREEMVRLHDRNLHCIRMYELLTIRIQSFLIKPFRFFTKNL